MRWHEIIEASDVLEQTRDLILDMLAPLQSQHVKSVLVKQVIQNISGDPDLSGINVTPDMIKDALEDVDGFSVETNAHGQLVIQMTDTQAADAPLTPNKDKSKVDKAALRTVNRDL
jgi:hypothetical protein